MFKKSNYVANIDDSHKSTNTQIHNHTTQRHSTILYTQTNEQNKTKITTKDTLST